MPKQQKYRGVPYGKKPRPQLDEVFGVGSSFPRYTYVDRSNLDQRFRYCLRNEKHLVIYGASKQGKTVLRKKNLEDDRCVVIQCRSNSTLESIYSELLNKLEVRLPKELSQTTRSSKGSGIKASAKTGMLSPIAGDIQAHLSEQSDFEQTQAFESIGANIDNLSFVLDSIRASNKKVVIEDFHYLPESQKKRFSFDLKIFWDNSIFLIIVGVWFDNNLLQYYNGDLSGRINEIDVSWKNEELLKVLEQGEKALNIKFADKIKARMVNDAVNNVGLVQQLAETFCYASAILEYEENTRLLSDASTLTRCRNKICEEYASRYRRFAEVVRTGLRVNRKSKRVYERIVRICIECFSEEELYDGVHRNSLYLKFNICEPVLDSKDMNGALAKINRLQIEKDISPLVFSYNEDSNEIKLVDLNLMFFHKYRQKFAWPWEKEDESP